MQKLLEKYKSLWNLLRQKQDSQKEGEYNLPIHIELYGLSKQLITLSEIIKEEKLSEEIKLVVDGIQNTCERFSNELEETIKGSSAKEFYSYTPIDIQHSIERIFSIKPEG